MAAMVTVIAVPMIHGARPEPPSKALLLQAFSTNLTVLGRWVVQRWSLTPSGLLQIDRKPVDPARRSLCGTAS